MKHRSVVIFIVLAASLAAIPQASRELAAFKNAIGERVQIEIWNAFLDLNVQGRRSVPASAEPRSLNAVCESAQSESSVPVWNTVAAKNDAAKQGRKEPAPRKSGSETARIIVDPSYAPQAFSAAWRFAGSPVVVNHELRPAPKVDLARADGLAMIVPPGAGFDFDALTTAAPQLRMLERRARGRHVEVAGLKKQTNAEAARARREQHEVRLEAKRVRDELRRLRIEEVDAEGGDKVKPAEGLFKILKVKAPDKNGIPAPMTWVVQPGKEVSCGSPASPAQPAPAALIGE